jgi:quercetin dioxygenase-like cupin family protein
MMLMMGIRKLNVSQIAAQLDQPFMMANVAIVGDIAVSVYICQGTLEWHRHPHIDELFWVYEGAIVLESELGDQRLRPGELAVVPKGVSHRSGAEARASVLLLRCDVASERKNGRRRLYTVPGEKELERIGLRGLVRSPAVPFRFQTAAWIEDSVLQVAQGDGVWPAEPLSLHDSFVFVLEGTATVRTSEIMLHLHKGDFTVIPEGTACQLSTTKGTIVVRLTNGAEGGQNG